MIRPDQVELHDVLHERTPGLSTASHHSKYQQWALRGASTTQGRTISYSIRRKHLFLARNSGICKMYMLQVRRETLQQKSKVGSRLEAEEARIKVYLDLGGQASAARKTQQPANQERDGRQQYTGVIRSLSMQIASKLGLGARTELASHNAQQPCRTRARNVVMAAHQSDKQMPQMAVAAAAALLLTSVRLAVPD